MAKRPLSILMAQSMESRQPEATSDCTQLHSIRLSRSVLVLCARSRSTPRRRSQRTRRRYAATSIRDSHRSRANATTVIHPYLGPCVHSVSRASAWSDTPIALTFRES
eukprot:3774251-Pleurochrysis_carterae.AAC.1